MENENCTIKRHRGAQPGNRNARKHGFYSRNLTPAEICEFLNITNAKRIDRETAVLRIKLQSVLQSNPGNRRVLMEAVKLLVNLSAAKYDLDKSQRIYMKKFVRRLFTQTTPNEPANRQNKTFLQNESNLFSQTNRRINPEIPLF
jgi:hypothetical protein